MNKAKLLRALNPILLVDFFVVATTGVQLLLDLNFPNPELVYEFHKYSGLLMIVLVIFHLMLNWSWIKTNILKRKMPTL